MMAALKAPYGPAAKSISRPLTLEPELGPDFGGLQEWPLEHVVKVLCFCHPDDPAAMAADQEETLTRLFHACRRNLHGSFGCGFADR